MTATAIPWVERIEHFTRHVVQAKPGARFPVVGKIGRGKTRLLRDVAAQLVLQHHIPIYLSPPRREEDTAGAALTQAADTLKLHTLLNGRSATLTDLSASREEKLGVIVGAMQKAPNSVVVLLDEPHGWAAGEWLESRSEAGRRFARQVAEGLMSRTGCRVVYTDLGFGVGETESPYYLPKAWSEADLPARLTGHTHWQEVSTRLRVTGSEQLTPLMCRLLTILAILTSPEEVAEASRTCLDVEEVATLLAARSEVRPSLRTVWARLALVRTTIDDQLYALLANELAGEHRFVVEELLLTRVEGGYDLSPLLAKSIHPKQVLGNAYGQVQRQLAQFYLARSASLTDLTEAYFHAAEVGDDAVIERVPPFFVEQLHLRGRGLSRQKKYREAAEVFRRAVELDSADDYGNHYRAFNLDCIAEDQPAIETGYQEAIRLNPQHPWWHSRWINYLITVGRTAGARAAFAQASEDLQRTAELNPEYVYRSLHSWVAALLLQRAQLEFARQVLERVPASVRQEHLGFIALDQKLLALEEARRGRGVFPLSVPASQHWSAAPHLDFPLEVEGERRMSWFPARVETVSHGAVTLVVGKPPEQGRPATYGRIELPCEQFDRATLDERAAELRPGRFLVLAFYGTEGALKIRVHPQQASQDPNLPYLNPPDSLRYLRKQEPSS